MFCRFEQNIDLFTSFYSISQWKWFRGTGQRKRLLLKKNDTIDFADQQRNWINERIGLKYWIYLIWCFMGYCGLFRRVLIISMVNKLDEIFGNIGFIDLDNNIGSITGLN